MPIEAFKPVDRKRRREFAENLDAVKETLSGLLKSVDSLKQKATTEKEKELAENLFYAIDNALDISSTRIR